jgi:hypothetical protein
MRALITALMVIGLATPAVAGFIENRSQWNSLSEAQKSAYAMGLLDARVQVADSTSEFAASNAARLACLIELGITSSDLATIIDEGYARNAERWSAPPIGVLLMETNVVCRTQLNAAMERGGFSTRF